MNDYISRKAAIEAFENADADVLEDYGDGACDWGFGMKNIQEVLNSVPSANVEPVRHGRWKSSKIRSEIERCSKCEKVFRHPSFYVYKFCPNCGAKMDLEDDNGNK